MQSKPESPMDYSALLRLAQSPAGQQLIAALKQSQGDNLSQAMAKAAIGDYTHAQKIISDFLSTPEGKSLLQQFGR